ncbi:MAG: DUF4276 family protein [Thermoguttaceae bacterium]
MSREIRLYIEGGGDREKTKRRLRTAFGVFLSSLRARAEGKGVRWNVAVCGSGGAAYDNYKTALKSHPDAFNVLLVDAEGPVATQSPWHHLGTRPEHQWKNPGVEDKHCHLMTQIMEAWFLADPERLGEYYRQGFNPNALPKSKNVEGIDKQRVLQSLDDATRATQKGRYHKTRHAPEILERIRPEAVCSAARLCKRLFDTLQSEIDGA